MLSKLDLPLVSMTLPSTGTTGAALAWGSFDLAAVSGNLTITVTSGKDVICSASVPWYISNF